MSTVFFHKRLILQTLKKLHKIKNKELINEVEKLEKKYKTINTNEKNTKKNQIKKILKKNI